MRPGCEHLSLCVGVQAALGGSLPEHPCPGSQGFALGCDLWASLCSTSSSGGITSLRVGVRFGFWCALALGFVPDLPVPARAVSLSACARPRLGCARV